MKSYISTLAFLAAFISLGLPSRMISMEEPVSKYQLLSYQLLSDEELQNRLQLFKWIYSESKDLSKGERFKKESEEIERGRKGINDEIESMQNELDRRNKISSKREQPSLTKEEIEKKREVLRDLVIKRRKEREKKKPKQEEIEYFATLPDHIIIGKILPNQKAEELMNLRKTSKRMKKLVDEFIPQYKKQLNDRYDEFQKQQHELAFSYSTGEDRKKLDQISDEMDMIINELINMGMGELSNKSNDELFQRYKDLRTAMMPKKFKFVSEDVLKKQNLEQAPLQKEKMLIEAELEKRGVKIEHF